MITIEHRLIATQVTDEPNNDKNLVRQKQMDEKYKGKARETGRETPEGTFTKSPSGIANDLKQHSKDFGQASSKLNGYINRKGRNLQGGDRSRLYDAKEALKNAYGDQDKTTTEALVEGPINSGKFGVGGDNKQLETGIGEHIEDGGTVKTNAAVRLVLASKWSKEVTDHDNKSAVPDGTFTKSASDIAKTLKRVSKDHAQAAERLNFYKNRGGKNVDHAKLDQASKILKGLYS